LVFQHEFERKHRGSPRVRLGNPAAPTLVPPDLGRRSVNFSPCKEKAQVSACAFSIRRRYAPFLVCFSGSSVLAAARRRSESTQAPS
jgi:hypothetical protein